MRAELKAALAIVPKLTPNEIGQLHRACVAATMAAMRRSAEDAEDFLRLMRKYQRDEPAQLSPV